jgi:alpha-tubulin suppressor-like RCC1 family protein
MGAVVTTIPLYDHQIDRIAAGSYHGMAHSDYDGRIYAWGYNGYGALGIPPGSPVYTPVALPVSDATSNITDLAAGNFFSFLIRANASECKIFATGDNQSGQLGLNHYMTQPTPALTGF